MATIKEITYQCDICKRTSKSKDFNNGSQCGSAIISIIGHEGGMAWNGDWGGANFSDKFEVCFECSKKVKNFIGKIVGSGDNQ